MNTNKLLLGAAVLALTLVAFAPTVQAAAAPNAGTFVKAGDVDAVYAYAAAPHAALCFVDQNNDGGQQASEPLYLSQTAACAGAADVVAGDIRLTAGFGEAAGSTVTGADDDLSRNAIAAFAGAGGYKFVDLDGNLAYNPGDVVYVGAAGAVAINDVAVNGPNAFQRVTSTSPNYNVPTFSFAAPAVAGAVTAVGANEMFFNADGIAGFGVMDELYLSAPAVGAAPKVGDIRLTGLGTTYAGATTVAGADLDVTVVLPATPVGGVCFVDTNGDTLVSAGEPIYLQFTTPACGANSVAAGDYRVLATAGKSGGTLVGGGDDDFARNTVGLVESVVAPGAACAGIGLCFYDGDGSGAFSVNDPVYLNMDAGGAVSVNDVILSGSSANTQVTSSTSGLNNALVVVPSGAGITGIGFFNADAVGGAAVTTNDFLYLPTVAPGAAVTPGVGALRLVAVGGKAAGTFVVSPDVDLNAAPIASAVYASLCFVDQDSDVVQDTGEPVYMTVTAAGALGAACGNVAALAIRMTSSGSYQAGTLVKGSDDDFSRVVVHTGASNFGIYDADASLAYTNGEDLFVNFGAAPGAITPNDIQVTSNKFDRVTTATAGLNSPLTALPTTPTAPAVLMLGADIFATETDGLAGFTVSDTVYIDMDGSGTVTVGDVRLTALGTTAGQIGGNIGGQIGGSGSGSGSASASPSGSASASPSGSASGSVTPAPTDDESDTETGGNKTPGFELVALVAALGAALVMVRRKL